MHVVDLVSGSLQLLEIAVVWDLGKVGVRRIVFFVYLDEGFGSDELFLKHFCWFAKYIKLFFVFFLSENLLFINFIICFLYTKIFIKKIRVLYLTKTIKYIIFISYAFYIFENNNYKH